MSSCDVSGLSPIIFHFDGEDEVTWYLLISWKWFVFAYDFEGNSHSFHFLPHCVHPQRVAVFLVNCLTFGNALRHSQPKFVSCLVVSHVYSRNHAVSLLESVLYPPGESGLVIDALGHSVFSHFNWIRLLDVSESLPRRCSILPLDAKVPPLGGLP